MLTYLQTSPSNTSASSVFCSNRRPYACAWWTTEQGSYVVRSNQLYGLRHYIRYRVSFGSYQSIGVFDPFGDLARTLKSGHLSEQQR